MTRARLAALGPPLLLAVGLAPMAGDLVGARAIRGVAAAWGASPAPEVFTAVRGLETCSTRFFLEWRETGGESRSLEITPQLDARIAGPYDRRNCYGAAIARGPHCATDPTWRPLFDAVARFALCGSAPLLAELGADPSRIEGPVRIRFEPREGTAMGDLPNAIEVDCP